MVVPTDFNSFCGGVDLRQSALLPDGRFRNLHEDYEPWERVGVSNTFVTKNGLEGLDFKGVQSERVVSEMPALNEATVLVVAHSTAGSRIGMVGGAYAGGRTWQFDLKSWNLNFYIGGAATSAETAPVNNGRANVYVGSFWPNTGTIYSQINANGFAQATAAASVRNIARQNWPTISVGGSNADNFIGWIGRVLLFDRCLHVRDKDRLRDLVSAELARLT